MRTGIAFAFEKPPASCVCSLPPERSRRSSRCRGVAVAPRPPRSLARARARTLRQGAAGPHFQQTKAVLGATAPGAETDFAQRFYFAIKPFDDNDDGGGGGGGGAPSSERKAGGSMASSAGGVGGMQVAATTPTPPP